MVVVVAVVVVVVVVATVVVVLLCVVVIFDTTCHSGSNTYNYLSALLYAPYQHSTRYVPVCM